MKQAHEGNGEIGADETDAVVPGMKPTSIQRCRRKPKEIKPDCVEVSVCVCIECVTARLCVHTRATTATKLDTRFERRMRLPRELL